MIQIEARHLRIYCPLAARRQSARELLRLGADIGRGNLGLFLALRRDLTADEARALLRAAPDDLDDHNVTATFAWVGQVSGNAREARPQ